MAPHQQETIESQHLTTPACFVFDACALIAYFNDEAGADKAERLIEQAREGEVQLYASSINRT